MRNGSSPAIGPHITALYAENIKKLRVVRITPDGNVIQITGANGSGKSSVLDAIFWALGGTKGVETVPIRRGEEKAVVELSLGPVTVTRKFTAAGSTLTVESESGAKYPSPQRLLDDLLGSLTFDPLAFERMAPKARLEELRRIAPLPPEVDVLDSQNRADFERRTDVNRRIRDLYGEVSGCMKPDPVLLARQVLDPVEAIRALQAAGEINARRAKAREEFDRLGRHRDLQLDNARARREQAQRLLAEATAFEASAEEESAQLRAALPIEPPIDTEALQEAAVTIQQESDRVKTERAKLQRLQQLRDQLTAAENASEGLTQVMDARTRKRTGLIATASMPVPGLGYGEGDVLFDGLPFDQASSAERLRISMAIAMAGNPKLRVLRIKDGSLLDEHSLALVAEMAAERDFQVWLERVDTSGLVGVVMDDGAVAGAEAVVA